MRKKIDIDELEIYPKVYREIKKFYPIGLKSCSKEFNNFSGIKSLTNLIDEKIIQQNNFENHWEKGIKVDIENETGYKIESATFGFVPSYGGIIRFEKTDSNDINWQLNFYISFIGNFFVIQLRNQCLDTFENKNAKYGYTIKKMIVSPTENFYGEVFLKVEDAIRKSLKDAVFLPFCLYSTRLMGLSVIHSDEFDYPIGGAFFDAEIPSTVPEKVIGNIYYKLEELTKSF